MCRGVTSSQAGVVPDPWSGRRPGIMTMLAEKSDGIEEFPLLDAVVGGDTHRDTHQLEMLTGQGVLISTISIDNDADGYELAIAWIVEHAPGRRVLVGREGRPDRRAPGRVGCAADAGGPEGVAPQRW